MISTHYSYTQTRNCIIGYNSGITHCLQLYCLLDVLLSHSRYCRCWTMFSASNAINVNFKVHTYDIANYSTCNGVKNVKHLRRLQHCFLMPGPPNLFLSKQLVYSSQFVALHPSQSPHRFLFFPVPIAVECIHVQSL